jgi:hypothetical protein
MRFFRHWYARLLIAALLLAFVGGAGILNDELKVRRLSSAYETIQIGDSRERLVELSGTPHSNESYRDPASVFPLKVDHEDLRYDYFYQSWYYAFDRNGKLIQKVRCVLGEYCSKVGQ